MKTEGYRKIKTKVKNYGIYDMLLSMLEAFFRQKFEKPDSEEKRIQLITQLFDAHVDFLRVSSRFPNPVVNSVFQEIWRFIEQKNHSS